MTDQESKQVKKRVKKELVELAKYYNNNKNTTHTPNKDEVLVGIDEAGRGCLFGPVCAAAVIWDNTVEHELVKHIRDSKKISKKKRLELKEFIEKNAVAYGVAFIDNNTIDEINILNATMRAMHDALDKIKEPFDRILVDGGHFKFYHRDSFENIVPHHCITEGDNKYINIAAASILAKTTRDLYIEQLVEDNSKLADYKLEKNMGYGTMDHQIGIQTYGVTEWHRKTFAKVKEYV